MQFLDNIIILLLITLAFIAGKKISDRYYKSQIDELDYIVRLQAVEKGVGYVPQQQPKRYIPIGQPFMDKLKENGRAVQKINPKHS